MKTTKRKILQTERAHFACGWAFLALALVLATVATPAHAVPRIFNDPTPTSQDEFGRSVALDGNNVLIGAWGDDTLGENVGQAHLFDAVTGNLLQTFNNPTPAVWDSFGNSVALDGNNVLIGAWNDNTLGTWVGQAYLFTIAGGNDLPGDFDLDTDVDGNDLLQWQRGESPNPLSATDYANWQTNFGTVSPDAASVVPEPNSLLLAVLAIWGVLMPSRRKRKEVFSRRSPSPA